MTGFVVLWRESDLEHIAACWPAATLANTARAHYPDCATFHDAVIRAARDFGTVPGHLVMSYGEAMERVRQLVEQRRSRRQRQHIQHGAKYDARNRTR